MKHRYRGESGQILPLTALLIIPLLIIAAFAIDVGSFYLRASELQTVSDISSLAGAEALGSGASEAEVRQLIEDILESNGLLEDGVTYQVIIEGDNVSVIINDGDLRQYFSTLIVDEMSVQRDATATVGSCFGCETPIEIVSDSVTFPAVGNGDGYKVEIVEVGDDLWFYALNHHLRSDQASDITGLPPYSQLVCVSANTRSLCPGFSQVRFDTATTMESTITYTEASNRLWFTAMRPDIAADNGGTNVTGTTAWGIGCFELNGTPCAGLDNGMYTFDTEDRVSVRWSLDTVGGGDIGQYASDPASFGDRVFMIDYDMRVHCFDTVTLAECWAPQIPSEYAPARNDNWIEFSGSEWSTEVSSVPHFVDENKLYVGFTGRSGSGSNVVCYDMQAEAPCDGGWDFWRPSIDGGLHWIFPAYSAAEGESGACVTGTIDRGQPICRTESGSAVEDPALGAAIREARGTDIRLVEGNPERHNSRIFLPFFFNPDTNDMNVICMDTATNTACGDRASQPDYDPWHTPYAFTQLPNRDCFASHGHRQRFDFFDSNMNSCSPNGSTQRIERCTCDDGTLRWGTLNFASEFLDNFERLEVTLLADDGTVIVGPVDVLAENGRIVVPETADDLQYLNLEIDSVGRAGVDLSAGVIGSVRISDRATLID